METQNQYQRQMLNDSIKKIGNAMDKIKFDDSLSAQEHAEIRQSVFDAKASISILDCHSTGFKEEIELLNKAANMLEKAMKVVDCSNCI